MSDPVVDYVKAAEAWLSSPELCGGPLFDALVELRDGLPDDLDGLMWMMRSEVAQLGEARRQLEQLSVLVGRQHADDFEAVKAGIEKLRRDKVTVAAELDEARAEVAALRSKLAALEPYLFHHLQCAEVRKVQPTWCGCGLAAAREEGTGGYVSSEEAARLVRATPLAPDTHTGTRQRWVLECAARAIEGREPEVKCDACDRPATRAVSTFRLCDSCGPITQEEGERRRWEPDLSDVAKAYVDGVRDGVANDGRALSDADLDRAADGYVKLRIEAAAREEGGSK